jgi:hypothetical protein
MKIFRWNVWGIFQANERTASRKSRYSGMVIAQVVNTWQNM